MRGLLLNTAYRYGMGRVGCSVCPFASFWDEYISKNIDENTINFFLEVINEYAKSLGLSERERIEFIKDGQWKKRAGGRGITTNGTMMLLSYDNEAIKAYLKKPRENLLEWLKVAGNVFYKYNNKSQNKVIGELRIGNKNFSWEMLKVGNTLQFFINLDNDPITKEKIKKIIYKATYCVHCEACEAECPTEALKVSPRVSVNTVLCIHCGNCLNFSEKGCLVAKSISVYGGVKEMKKERIATSKFQTFGLRREWLLLFLADLKGWFSNNNLGNRQLESLKAWLRGCEFLEKNKSTLLAELLSKIRNKDETFIWGIVWVNLYYNINSCVFG